MARKLLDVLRQSCKSMADDEPLPGERGLHRRSRWSSDRAEAPAADESRDAPAAAALIVPRKGHYEPRDADLPEDVRPKKRSHAAWSAMPDAAGHERAVHEARLELEPIAGAFPLKRRGSSR